MNARITLKEAAKSANLTEFYVRKCIRLGSLKAQKYLVPGADKVERYEIDSEVWQAWLSREKRNVGKRPDNRNKYVLYATEPEFAELLKIEAVAALLGEGLLLRANPPKH